MGGVRIAARAVVIEAGTPFWVINQIWNGTAVEQSGDIWQVPLGAAAGDAEQITAATGGVFGSGLIQLFGYPLLSPDRSKILYQYDTDTGPDRHLGVMNADGSGQVIVNAVNGTANPCWAGNDVLVFMDNFDNTNLYTVNADGTGKTQILDRPGGMQFFHASPDGTQVAYVATVAGNITLGVCDIDGSNDAVLVASGVFGTYPVWTLDGTQILYLRATGSTRLIEPDGTNDTEILAAPGPTGFWYPTGMGTDRIFYANTSGHGTAAGWRLAYIMLDGSGDTIISPNRRLSQAVQRAVGHYDDTQGRVFSTLHDADPASNGVDAIFSTLPDGTDFRIHFDATEENWTNPGDNFQVIGFR